MAGRARTLCACSLSVPRGQQEAQEDQPGSAHGGSTHKAPQGQKWLDWTKSGLKSGLLDSKQKRNDEVELEKA